MDGSAVELATLRGPLIINVWAAWCEPCRRELPVFQRFTQRREEVRVLGVVSATTARAATELATDFGLTFPHLRDDRGRLLRELGRTALPSTLFVDDSGRIQSIYSGKPLNENTLDELANEFLRLETSFGSSPRPRSGARHRSL